MNLDVNENAPAKSYAKPPVGVRPKFAWEQESYRQRLAEINGGIERYIKAQMPIPQPWLDERNELLEKLSK